MAIHTPYAKKPLGAKYAPAIDDDDELDEDESSLSPSGQDAPNKNGGKSGGKPNPLKLWAQSMLG